MTKKYIYDAFVDQNCKDIKTLNDLKNIHNTDRENRYCDTYEFVLHKPMQHPNLDEKCYFNNDINNVKLYSDALGYDCMSEPNSLLLNPDTRNTFKNYPVITETGDWCSRNHQMFNNWTRRNIHVQAPKRKDLFKLPGIETQELTYNDCRKPFNTGPAPYICNDDCENYY